MTADLSPRGRAANLARMGSEPFDLVVVGGGIVGAAIARDAAMRGLKIALLERNDFASGTSGKTSRLVHGGLRYLKNLRIGLVRQAVRERDVLLEQAPALVRPLAFTIPAYTDRGTGRAWLRFGLFVYDFLSRDKVLPRRQWLSPQEAKEREPNLRDTSLVAGGLYHDALTNDARLVLAVVRAAADAGAVVSNYAEAIECVPEGGRIAGVRVRDRMSGNLLGIRASLVVNATGVWLDWLRSSKPTAQTVRPTKGVHVFLPRERVGNRGAVVVTAKRDGRVIFVLPWGRLTLIGTTDTDFRGDPDDVVPNAEDVGYLLESVNEAFPAAHIGSEDVVSAYAGLRPLIHARPGEKESDISREHEVLEDPDGLISVAGGKLTTQRAMAEDVVDRVCKRLGRAVACSTVAAPLGPHDAGKDAFVAMGFNEETSIHLSPRCEPDALRRWLDEPRARERITSDLPYVWAEVCEAVEAEMALTLPDVLVRRLGLFYEDREQGRSVARSVAERMAGHLAWSEERIRSEVTEYEELVAHHRGYREAHGR